MRFLILLLMGMCGRPWSVYEVVMVPHVNAVTVMCVLLFVLDVSMLRECEGVKVTETGVGDGGGVFGVSAGHEYVDGGWYTWFRYCV